VTLTTPILGSFTMRSIVLAVTYLTKEKPCQASSIQKLSYPTEGYQILKVGHVTLTTPLLTLNCYFCRIAHQISYLC